MKIFKILMMVMLVAAIFIKLYGGIREGIDIKKYAMGMHTDSSDFTCEGQEKIMKDRFALATSLMMYNDIRFKEDIIITHLEDIELKNIRDVVAMDFKKLKGCYKRVVWLKHNGDMAFQMLEDEEIVFFGSNPTEEVETQ